MRRLVACICRGGDAQTWLIRENWIARGACTVALAAVGQICPWRYEREPNRHRRNAAIQLVQCRESKSAASGVTNHREVRVLHGNRGKRGGHAGDGDPKIGVGSQRIIKRDHGTR